MMIQINLLLRWVLKQLHDLLQRIDLDQLSFDLRNAAATETSQQRKADALKRLSVVEAFRDANTRINNRPEWMVMQYIPVIPPELASIGSIGWWSFCIF